MCDVYLEYIEACSKKMTEADTTKPECDRRGTTIITDELTMKFGYFECDIPQERCIISQGRF